MCTIEENTGTIAATGTTPHTTIMGCSQMCQAIITGVIAGNRHYSTGTIAGGTANVVR